MRYVVSYFVGGVIAMIVADHIWSPLPDWIERLHGVRLGLLVAGIFLTGSFVACIAVYIAGSTKKLGQSRGSG